MSDADPFSAAESPAPVPATTHPLDALGDEIAALAGQIETARHALLTRIRAFDESGGWARQGALSCAHWLGWRIGLAPGAAREKVRVARALAPLPRIDEALARAEISYSKVRALTRIATPANEERLLAVAKTCTAAHLETLCRQYRGVIAGLEGRPADTERWVRQRWTDAGMVRLEAQLSPDEAALVMKAIEAARAPAMGEPRPRPPAPDDAIGAPERETLTAAEPAAEPAPRPRPPPAPPSVEPWPTRADALVAVAEHFLASAPAQARPGGERYTIVVHLGPDEHGVLGGAGASLEDGTHVPAETLRRIACDAGLVPLAEDAAGQTLDVGRRRRTIPPALRRALVRRHGGCCFPGCTNRQFVDAHHIQHWMYGGRTALDNLVLLCGAHHRLAHEGGFGVQRAADGSLRFVTPDGTPVPQAPARAPDAELPTPLAASRPLPIPAWWGERVDHGLMVSELLGPDAWARAATAPA
ncbi:MAG TPA: DUF222 domain-containing protein [Myxococcota bacterium]|jgi:hypothetical protein|nr:DUF222 domain-containing protein [Myxococcota bacterium]